MFSCLHMNLLDTVSWREYLEAIVIKRSENYKLIPIKVILFVQQAGQDSLLGMAFSASCYCGYLWSSTWQGSFVKAA